MWLPVVCAALLEVALCKELTLSVWSYSPYPGWGDEPMGTPPMWSVDDWITVDAQGKATPWVTTILATPATGANQTVWAELSAAILSRTGVSVPVFWSWSWENWDTAPAIAAASFARFRDEYAALVAAFPHLPPAPYGVFLGDEPPVTAVLRLQAATRMVKEAWPATITYLNWKWSDLTGCALAHCGPQGCQIVCDNATHTGTVVGGRQLTSLSVASFVGNSSLDWVSSDEYYDVPMATYQDTYKEHVYPFLAPQQRVILLPFAAYCEIGCAANTPLDLAAGDTHCLGNAKSHVEWWTADPKVLGLVVYRFKNIWWSNGTYGGADPCTNPGPPLWPTAHSSGLGLVDRCGPNGSGSAALPNTLRYYHTLLQNQGKRKSIMRLKNISGD